MLRLAWNKLDPNYLATFMADSAKTFIIGPCHFYIYSLFVPDPLLPFKPSH